MDSNPNIKMFSIGQVVGESVFKDDFRKRFSGINDEVALRMDERFAGLKFVITESMAIKHTEVWWLLDGLVVY